MRLNRSRATDLPSSTLSWDKVEPGRNKIDRNDINSYMLAKHIIPSPIGFWFHTRISYTAPDGVAKQSW
jgi:hypothetical protein